MTYVKAKEFHLRIRINHQDNQQSDCARKYVESWTVQ